MIQFSNLHKCFLTKWIHHNTGASVFFSKIVQYKQMDAQALEHSGLKLYEIDALNS